MISLPEKVILSPTTGQVAMGTKESKTQSLKTIVMVGAILLGWYGLSRAGIVPMSCVFHELTGMYCPGCGITRMFEALLRGNPYQAFRYNQFLFGLLVATPVWIGIISVTRRSEKCSQEQIAKVNNGAIWLSLGGAAAFGILRNIPAFSWLAPTVIH